MKAYRTRITRTPWRKYLTWGIIASLLLLALFIRLQGAKTLPPGLLRGPDAYHYYKLAQTIAEAGHLPPRDMSCWLPIGRDLSQTLNLYPYALAWTHAAITVVFPNVTLYHVTAYAPVVCFCIGLGALAFFFYHVKGSLFAISVTAILSTLPGSIERSIVGASDRDSWCLMLGILSILTYLMSLPAPSPMESPPRRPPRGRWRKRVFWTLCSGFFVCLGGLSWEGFGVFLSVILIVELWRFLTSEREEGLGLYALWMCCFVPTLYLVSPAYRNGYGFAEHLAAFVLVPPLVLFGLRGLRYLLLSKIGAVRQYARILSLGCTLISLALAIGYVLTQLGTFAETTIPFSQNQLMQSVEELQAPVLVFWLFRYGGILLFGCFGLLLMHLHSLQKSSKALVLFPALFVITLFFREPLDTFIGSPEHGTLLFFFSCLFTLITFLFIASTRKTPIENETLSIAFLAYFCLWAALARGAARYDVFIGIALAFYTTEMVIYLAENIRENLPIQRYGNQTLKTAVAVLMLAILIFFKPFGGHATRTLDTATHLNFPFPQENATVQTMQWMKNNLNRDAVVAADWSYGAALNVLGGVKTFIDQDHYIQNWIRLYYKYIYTAAPVRDSLAFLKTHDVTHLMLTAAEPKNRNLFEAVRGVFVPVYPQTDFAKASVQLWEIHYPPDIQTDVKYLKTGVPEIDDQLPLH